MKERYLINGINQKCDAILKKLGVTPPDNGDKLDLLIFNLDCFIEKTSEILQ